MVISFRLPRPGSARFVLRGHIRSYTEGFLRDLLRLSPGPLPAFLTAMARSAENKLHIPLNEITLNILRHIAILLHYVSNSGVRHLEPPLRHLAVTIHMRL